MKTFLLISALAVCALGAQVGIRIGDGAPRVVGGQDAREHEFPYQLSLQQSSLWGARHICGASILNKNWAVTAAHCVDPSNSYKIVANITNLNENGIVRKVKKIIVHENYNGGVAPNDIALLKFESALPLGYGVQAVKMPERNEKPYGKVILSGWGSTSTTQFPSMPKQLQKITLPVLSQKICEDAIKKLTGSVYPLVNTNVCTGPLDESKSACSGDSGGPLVQDGHLVGIVSWGFMPCGTVGSPSVFTQVSSFIDWIEAHMH